MMACMPLLERGAFKPWPAFDDRTNGWPLQTQSTACAFARTLKDMRREASMIRLTFVLLETPQYQLFLGHLTWRASS